MNDDLISKSAVLQIIYEIKDDSTPKNYGTLLDIIRQIRELPAAFDKEKVIEELRQEAMYELGIPENKFNSDEGEYSCYRSITFAQAKRIVEKGGIE